MVDPDPHEPILEERVGFETLIAEMASDFVNLESDQIDGAIYDGQARLGRALGFDRSALFQFIDDRTATLTHLWSRPEIQDIEPQPTYRTARFTWAAAHAANRQPVYFSSLRDLPDSVPDGDAFERIGTKSNVTIPLIAAARVIGVLTFDTVRAERQWPPDLVKGLALAGQVFASTLARRRTEAELHKTLEENVRLRERLAQENVYLRHEAKQAHGASGIVGRGPALQRVLDEVDQVAPTGATVLLLGETGTGKELIATAIHERSPRRARAMVRINCAAIPITLIESELFGREKGAYTGALTRQIGRFELAHESTLFLDEVGELPSEVQVKLLRVLQEKEIERLGSSRPVRVDVRVIAATNRDLERAVGEGTFREDLYYRLNVFPIQIPPLRERPEDIPALVEAFVVECSKAVGKRIEIVPKEQLDALKGYQWPGNIRELRNVVERAVIVSTGGRLVIELPRPKAGLARRSLRIDDVEREHLLAVLEQTAWRIRGAGGAADLLGLKPSTLETRLVKLDVRRPPR